LARQNLEQLTGDAALAFDGLVGVGDGAERDDLGQVSGGCQLALQDFGGVGFGVELGFEVEPGGVPEVAMVWPRIAIDAAMLAAAIGIDRLVEGDIRAVVA